MPIPYQAAEVPVGGRKTHCCPNALASESTVADCGAVQTINISGAYGRGFIGKKHFGMIAVFLYPHAFYCVVSAAGCF